MQALQGRRPRERLEAESEKRGRGPGDPTVRGLGEVTDPSGAMSYRECAEGILDLASFASTDRVA